MQSALITENDYSHQKYRENIKIHAKIRETIHHIIIAPMNKTGP